MTAATNATLSHPVLLVNPRSGGGAAQHHDLVGQYRARGIEPVLLEQGDDLVVPSANIDLGS